MVRKFIVSVMFLLGCASANAAQIVNVEYIHKYINKKHDIDIPYSASLKSEKQAANMEYLLYMVDWANKKLNGGATTNYYADKTYATASAVDTTAANYAVDVLIHGPEYFFSFQPYGDAITYELQFSAAGTFYINWGDGVVEKIERPKATTYTSVSHNYPDAASNYVIKLGGRATAYYTANSYYKAIAFNGPLEHISGCLGCVFPTIGTGGTLATQPRFPYLFQSQSHLKDIPANLFDGIYGRPVADMFSGVFYMCTGLTGPIPAGLFGDISGAPTKNLFKDLFYQVGPNLKGEIPDGLFAGLDTNASAAESMFQGAFAGCSGLTGPSAKINGRYLYEIWPRNPMYSGSAAYSGATGLSDYNDIPSGTGWR